MSKPLFTPSIPKEREWETHLGSDPTERTKKIGQDSTDYRAMVNLPPTSDYRKITHNAYIHSLGADILKTMISEEQEAKEKQKKFMMQKQVTAIKKIRRRIKVDDFEDGGLSVAIEQDWDTSGWNEELIAAGMESLIYIFYNFHGEATIPRKERAILMIQKLLDRHREADGYLRKNVESIMAQSVSKYIRDGKAASVLDLLYVLCQTTERLVVEMSNFNYAGKLTEMMLQEARLAATLIQHTFRSMKAKMRLKNTQLSQAFTYFGTERQVFYRQIGVINARSDELRHTWRHFRSFYPKELTTKVGGARGPLHMGAIYVDKALRIMQVLVSEKAMLLAHSNREEIVKNDGCILLSNFLGTAQSPFSKLSAMIVADVSIVVESFLPMLQSGIIFSAVRLLQFLRKVYRVGSDILSTNNSSGNNNKKGNKGDIIRAFMSTMDMVHHLALHAAGFYRARYDYCYERKDKLSGGLEVINYKKQLFLLEHQPHTALIILLPLLCPRALLSEISTQITTASQPSILNHALRALFYLASSECQELVIQEIVGLSGKLMAHLISLLHHPCDHTNRMLTGNLVMALFLQLCSTAATRKALMLVNIPQYVVPLNQRYLLKHEQQSPNAKTQKPPASSLYKSIDSIEHMRGILVASALSRQGEWNYVDPEALLAEIYLGHNSDSSSNTIALNPEQSCNVSTISTWIREELLLTWLRTIKNVNYDGFNGHITIADLIIMPTDPYRAVASSRQAGTLCALEIVHALYRPENEYYYEALPLHEAVAVVEILEGFASYVQTARMMFAIELVRFLSKFLYLCKYIFLGKPMVTAQVMVVLNGVKASFVCMGRLCVAIKDDIVQVNRMCALILKTDLIATTLFFLNTLSTFDEKTDPEIIRLQKIVGISSLAFLHKLSLMLNVHYPGKDNDKHAEQKHTYGISSSVPNNNNNNNSSSNNNNSGNASQETLVLTIEDLFPSGETTVKIFQHLKDIIHTRHEHYQRDIVRAEQERAKFAHQARPVRSSLTSGSVLIASSSSSFADANEDAALGAEQRYRAINNASPSASPQPSPVRRRHPSSVFSTDHHNNNNNNNNSPNSKPHKAHQHDPYHATTSVTTHLHPRDEFLQVLDAICKFLIELTMFSPGAYAAVQEWHLFDTLKLYLPPPLSGLNDASDAFLRESMYVETRASVAAGVALSRNSVSMSRASSVDPNNSHSHGNNGNDNNATDYGISLASESKDGFIAMTQQQQQNANMSSPLQAALSTAAKFYGANRARPAPGMGTFAQGANAATDDPIIQQNKGVHDDVELIDLPSSYFQLCANLCRISDGTGRCFADGFLRRACDKTMALYVQLLQHRDPLRKTISSSPVFPWEYRKLDFIACLRVIAATANFHHPHMGSTNDLIFSTPYDIVLVCKTLVTLKLKRTEELVLVAYECLAALAQDTYRVNQILEFHDVYEDIRQELSLLTYHFPVRGVLACIRVIHGSTIGLASFAILSDYDPEVARSIDEIRSHLSTVRRSGAKCALDVDKVSHDLSNYI